MDRKLPGRPNLHHLKGQAKALLSSLNSGSHEAAQTLIDNLPSLAGLTPEEVCARPLRLADAQSALARANGFAGWPHLARYVEELRRLEGDWKFVSLEVEGNPVPVAALQGSRILMDGDSFRTDSPGAVYLGEFTIDVEEEPHHIDIEFQEGPEAGNWSYGIYKWSGEDLTICLGLTGASRPTEFRTTPGSGHALETLTRGQAPSVPSPQPEPEEGQWEAKKIVRDGMDLPAAFLKSASRTVNGNRVVVKVGGMVVVDAEFAVTSLADPAETEYRLADGAVQLGIMKEEGGELWFCYAAPGAPRPTEFTSSAGSGHTFSIWKKRP